MAESHVEHPKSVKFILHFNFDIQGIALCLSVILADVGLTLAQGSNQYLPPQEKGYDYKPPIAGFPSAPKPVQVIHY